MSADQVSQFEWFTRDLQGIGGLLQRHSTALSARFPQDDPNQNALHLVALELAMRTVDLAEGVHTLLTVGSYSPAVILVRSMFENLANLGYLVTRPDGHREGIVMMAHSYGRQLRQFPHQADLVAELEGIRWRMPQELVREGDRRSRLTGMHVSATASAASVEGYEQAYAHYSSEAHGSILSQHVKFRNGVMHLPRVLQAHERESISNFARRALRDSSAMLARVFQITWGTIPAEDPEIWRGQQNT